MPRSVRAVSSRIDRTTFVPGDFGRLVQPDGTHRWWVRASDGGWVSLSHQRVIENEDGSITLLYRD